MNPVLSALKDKKISNFVEELLIKGYAKYGIPKRIPIRIISVLRKSKSLNSAINRVYQIPEIKNKKSIFWMGRKNYEQRKSRHYEVLHFIKRWLKGKIILEVGCGSGDLGLIISKQFKIEGFVGTDIHLQKKRITTSRIKLKKQKTETEIPIKNSFADTVLLIDMLHHVSKSNQKKLLVNIRNKLKESGIIIFFEYTFSEIKEPLLKRNISLGFKRLSKNQKLASMVLIDWIGNILVLHRKIPMPYSYRTMEQWEKLFIKLNFQIVTSQYIGFPKNFFHQGPYGILVLKK